MNKLVFVFVMALVSATASIAATSPNVASAPAYAGGWGTRRVCHYTSSGRLVCRWVAR